MSDVDGVVALATLDDRMHLLDLGTGALEELTGDIDSSTLQMASDGSRVIALRPRAVGLDAVGWLRGSMEDVTLAQDAWRAVAVPSAMAAQNSDGVRVITDEGTVDHPDGVLYPQRFERDALVIASDGVVSATGIDAMPVALSSPPSDAQLFGAHWAVRTADMVCVGVTGSEHCHALKGGSGSEILHMDASFTIVRDATQAIWAIAHDGTLEEAGITADPEATPGHGGYYLGTRGAVWWWAPGSPAQTIYDGPEVSTVRPDAHGVMLDQWAGGRHTYVPLEGEITTWEDIRQPALTTNGDWLIHDSRGYDPGPVYRWSPIDGRQPLVDEGRLYGNVILVEDDAGTTLLDLDGAQQHHTSRSLEHALIFDDVVLLWEENGPGHRLLAAPLR